MLKKCRWLTGHLEEIFMVSSLGLITIAMFAQVVSRYVFGASLVWTEEISRYFFILMAFAGFSYCARSNVHLKIDLLETFVTKLKKPLEYFADACLVALCLFMISPARDAVVFIRNSGQFSAAMHLPIWIIYMPLMVAFFLVVIRVVEKHAKYFLAFRNRNKLVEEA